MEDIGEGEIGEGEIGEGERKHIRGRRREEGRRRNKFDRIKRSGV